MEEEVKNIFPNLRSDYFSLQRKSGENIFKNIFYFALVWLKPNYYALLAQEGQRSSSLFSLTEAGKKILTTKIGQQNFINNKEIEQFLIEECPEIWEKSLANPQNKKKQETITKAEDIEEKEEINFEQLHEEHIANLSSQILKNISSLHSRSVEILVGRLLEKMGYGEANPTKISGDGGVDIILDKDVLGLDKVLVQVKRYQTSQKIGTSHIRDFMGALKDYGLSNGIFVTTSDFTSDAYVLGKKHNIVLINGKKLCNYMIIHGLGVESINSYQFYQINTDFFNRYEKDN